LTLEGSFTARSILKRRGLTIGRVTRGEMNACSGGIMRLNAGLLPASTTYEGFAGALPAITDVMVAFVGLFMEVDPEGAFPNCNFVTNAEEPLQGIASVNARGEITGMRAEESSTIGTAGSFLCDFGTRGRFIGRASATVLGETGHTVVRLI
jgi:hypothetical protein